MFQRQRDDQARQAREIPPIIPCNSCGRKKNKGAFSNIQHGVLARHMGSNPKFRADLRPFICCFMCGPKQVVELHCHLCDKDKGLDSFSKNQRKDPDEAVCWECATARQAMEPGESDDDFTEGSRDGLSSDDEGGEDYSLPATSSHGGGSTVPGTYSSRMTSGGGVSLPSTTSNAASSSTGRWANSSAASTTGTSTVNGGGFQTVTNRYSKPAAPSSGFDANKYKPSKASSVAGSSRDRFAKIRAVKKAPIKNISDDSSDEDDVYLSGSD